MLSHAMTMTMTMMMIILLLTLRPWLEEVLQTRFED